METRWIKCIFDINDQEYVDLWQRRFDSPKAKTQRKYYAGFAWNKTKGDKMYRTLQELQSIEQSYIRRTEAYKDELNALVDVMTPYMERWIALNSSCNQLMEKLGEIQKEIDTHIY